MRHLFKTRIGILLLSAFIVLSLAAHAQQLHFIYIQADSKQPFSVNLNGKYYSSSATGYIILPKLTNGTYTLGVNFAMNSYPEQIFTVNIAGKDCGFALKNFDAKGWGLFNFQTTDVVISNAAASQENTPAGVITNTSAFGNMLADVVNDKSINTLSNADTVTTSNKNNQTATAANPPETVAATVKDTAVNAIAQHPATATDTLSETAAADTLTGSTPDFNTTGVIKAAENTGDTGTDLTFIDFNSTHNDTIKAFIPAAGTKLPAQLDTLDMNAKAAVADSTKNNINNPFLGKKDTAAAYNTTTAAVASKPKLMEDNQPITAAAAGNGLVNSTCTNMVSDGELSKLKKRIVAQTDQDAILQTVKKSLKNKCITTGQVKDLGNLFLNDDSRYGFYDSVYPFVYDYGNYASLESTLIASYYKTRFKALLH